MLFLHDDGGFYGFAHLDGPLVEYDQFLSPIRIVVGREREQIVLAMMEEDSFVGADQ